MPKDHLPSSLPSSPPSTELAQDDVFSMSPLILPSAALPCMIPELDSPRKSPIALTPRVKDIRLDQIQRERKHGVKAKTTLGRNQTPKQKQKQKQHETPGITDIHTNPETPSAVITEHAVHIKQEQDIYSVNDSPNYLPALASIASEILAKSNAVKLDPTTELADEKAAAPVKRRRRSNQSQCSEEERENRRRARKIAHSDIERRRRIKINEQFESLKILVPSCSQAASMEGGDAALHKLVILQKTVAYIRELKAELENHKVAPHSLATESPCLPSFNDNFNSHGMSAIIKTNTEDGESLAAVQSKVPPSGFTPRILPPPSPALSPNNDVDFTKRLKISSLLC